MYPLIDWLEKVNFNEDEMTVSVSIICVASYQIGLGHLARCLTLAESLSLLGFNVRVIVAGDKLVESFCEQRLGSSLSSYDFFVCEHLSKLNLSSVVPSNSTIILDVTNLSTAFLKDCLHISEVVMALDYFDFEGLLPSCIINVFDHSETKILVNRKHESSINYFEGLEYSIIRKEFIQARNIRIQKGEKADVSQILISFGGSDPKNNYAKALKLLENLPHKVAVNLVLGPLFRGPAEMFENTSSSNLDISLHSSVECLSELMLKADIVFCGGGGTLLESMAVGVPTVVFQQTPAEKRFSEFVAANGGCWMAEKLHDFDFLSERLRLTQSAQARNLVDGCGALRIGKIVQKYSSFINGVN